MQDRYIVCSMDFGASNSRLFLRPQYHGGVISPATRFVASRKTTRSIGPNGYLCEEVDIALNELLSQVQKSLKPEERKLIKVFSISSHGSSNFICLDRYGKTVFGTPSYDTPITKTDDELFYSTFGNPHKLYIETGTPYQPNALSWAKLLFHHMINYKKQWKKVAYVLPLSSYIAFRLCGSFDSLVSEHTHVHNHGYGENNAGDFSSVIKKMGIENLFPPFKKSYDIAGFINTKLADKYGFAKDAVVNVGGHDSSIFAMLPPLMGFGSAITVSSGTWDVIMALGRGVSIKPKMQEKGLLYNVTIENEPLRSVNFRASDMKLKYLEQFGKVPANISFDRNALNEIIKGNDIIVPAYMHGFGPYPNSDKKQKLPEHFKNNPVLFHHALSLSLAIQRAFAIEIAGRTQMPEKMMIKEFLEKPGRDPIVIGGHLAQNHFENGKDTGRLKMSTEILRRITGRKIYRLGFTEPTSLATHILGVCAFEGIKPQNLERGRIAFEADDITFNGDRTKIFRYCKVFEMKVCKHRRDR